MRRTVRHHPQKFAWSLSRAIIGEHMIRYTAEDVVPLIHSGMAQVRRERSLSRAGREAAVEPLTVQ